MKRNYRGYLYVIGYLLILRIVLHITIDLNAFNFGILFDTVLMMFWVGVLAFFFKKVKYQKMYYVVVMVVATFFVVGDSIYYDYFDIITSKTSLAGLSMLQEGQTLEYDIQIPLVAYLVTPLLLFFSYLIISNKERDVFLISDFKYLSFIFVIQVALFIYWGSHEFDSKIDYYRSDAYLFETMHDRVKFSEKYGYYNYHILDITRFRIQEDEEDMLDQVNDYFDALDVHQSNEYSDIFAGYNVITITAETLDTRFIDEILTPNLYMMTQEGYTYDNFFTPVFQQGATCNSEYMGLTGLYAITSNDWSNNICDSYSENAFPYSLPSQLQEIGYDTYYFHSGYEWFYNRNNMVPQYGFETVKFQEDIYALDAFVKTTEEVTDDQIVFVDKYDTQMMYFLDEYVDFTNPFYINLLTYSMHGAYNQSDLYSHEDRIEEAYPDNAFDEEILSYMEKLVEFDDMLGLLLDRLEEENILDQTIITIYPDHHIYMMDYNTYTEYLGIDVSLHEYELHRQTLIMYSPSMTPQVIHTPGSTVDITPTLLNMISSNSDFSYFMGNDLFSPNNHYIIFPDLTISDGQNYLTIDQDMYGDPSALLDLESALEHKIESLDIQKLLLNSDYFNNIPQN